jgi:hypothetical protein
MSRIAGLGLMQLKYRSPRGAILEHVSLLGARSQKRVHV